jgi:hypothetical protein
MTQVVECQVGSPEFISQLPHHHQKKKKKFDDETILPNLVPKSL